MGDEYKHSLQLVTALLQELQVLDAELYSQTLHGLHEVESIKVFPNSHNAQVTGVPAIH